jgi:flagellar hook-associated protein FlgK
MSDIFGISSNAVSAYQRALGAVSNNIANVGTDGYVRQTASLTENVSSKAGSVYIGTGVLADGIKRAYDQFLDTNLRNSNSDLATQGPMVSYANRIVDLMGSDTVGLPPAMDKFFASVNALSADPASTILRNQFLTDAGGLASRFNELSTQLSAVDQETRDTINSDVSSINTLSGQLATVNKQLSRETKIDSQPPELLDQRDRLLTSLSKLVKINVTTTTNGSVNISVGNTANSGTIVNGQKAIQLAAKFDESDLGKVGIVADPYGTNPTTIAGVSNGALGGLLGFREQVLQPTMTQFDGLAKSTAEAVNAVHRNGIDANGKKGQDLFTIAQVSVTDPVSGQAIKVDRASAGITLAITDPTKVAAGAFFRVIKDANNISGANASLSYAASYADPSQVKTLSQVLANNASPTAGVNVPSNQLLGQIPQGSSNWSLFMDNASSGQQLQVFTRDGRQLIGAPLPDDAARRALMTASNGFVDGSTYSSDYLNQSGVKGYKQESVFYGLKAEPGAHYAADASFTTEHNVLPTTRLNDELTGTAIPPTLSSIAANTLTLNGKALPALYPTAPAATIQASDIANWMNRAADGMVPTVAVNATTTATKLVDPASGMYINGVAVPADATRTTMAGLVSYINANLGNQANVVASESADHKLVLTNASGYGGDDIRIGTMNADTTLGSEEITKGTLSFSGHGDVTIGYGADGKLGAMDALGTPAGNYYTQILATEATDAQISGNRIEPNLSGINAGVLTLNGVDLPALAPVAPATTLKTADIISWFNSIGSNTEPKVTASGSNQIKATASQLNLRGDLTINGQSIGSNFADATAMVAAINSKATTTLVSASLADDGSVILANATGDDITLASNSNPNALGTGNGVYKGQLNFSSKGEIKIGFGEHGSPADLASLGLRTGDYIDGAASEDLLVFVTGKGSATVAGSFDASMADPATLDAARIDNLRTQKFDVAFTSATHYQISWTNPANNFTTVLAERDYDPKLGIDYQGLHISLDNDPTKGDKFVIDGNQDGVGNNQNMLDIAAIERKKVVGGPTGSTLSEAYSAQVGKVGNLANQATIAQSALDVVNKQAVASRDAVSGVSLDSEAADLIRFQQAYQAAAKAMQIAGDLFTSILQVR